MATSADQLNSTHLTQLLILNLGSRNACMRALIAHPTDLNAAADWLINHVNDANIDTDPFAAAVAASSAPIAQPQPQQQQQQQQHTQQHMLQQIMNLGYSREEALRAYTNVSTSDRNQTNKLVDYLVKNPKKEDKSSKSYNTYSSSNYSSYYPYSSSNKKKVVRPVINIDDIKVEKEEICDIKECECLEHIGIILREYKKFLQEANKDTFKAEACDKGKDYEQNGFYAYFMDTISGDGEYSLSDVMDDFIHLIAKHDIRYGEFSKIYEYIIGTEALNGALDRNIVNLMHRCQTCDDLSDLSVKYCGFKSVKEITIQQICDKIYCAIVDAYRVGSRLNKHEYSELDKKYAIAHMEADDNGFIKEKSIASYIGCKQYREYKKLLNNKNNNKFNFKLDVEQFEIRIDPKELKTKLAKEKLHAQAQVVQKKEEQPQAPEVETKEDDDQEAQTQEVGKGKKEDIESQTQEVEKKDVSQTQQVAIEKKEDKEAQSQEVEKKEERQTAVVVKKDDVDKGEFSFGVRYNYWAKDMEDLIAITVNEADAVHKTLRDELIENEICNMTEVEYNVLSEKAHIYFNSEHCQENIEAGVNSFGIRLLDKITVDHIIAMMVYCNYNAIRAALDDTYAVSDDDEHTLQHLHFYHLGKLLRESVDCYGVEAHQSQTKRFYHGMKMNTKIMSGVHALFIYPPFSSSSCMEMCLESELCLELKGYVSKYFDCWWISDLVDEKEQIFCGGTRALTVNKCIDTKYGFDHKLFLQSFKYIPQLFNNNEMLKYDDMLQDTKETIRNLLFYQLNKNGENLSSYPQYLDESGIPQDIKEKLDDFCRRTKELQMHYDAMYNHRAFGFLSSLFMTATRTFVKLDVIQHLFPKLETFKMVKAPLTTLTFMYIKSIINRNCKPSNVEDEKDDYKEGANASGGKTSIKRIEIIEPKTDAMSIAAVIQSEERSLAQLQWIIESPQDSNKLILRYSDVEVVIKEAVLETVVIEEKKEEEKQKEKPVKRRRKKVLKRKIKKAAAAPGAPLPP